MAGVSTAVFFDFDVDAEGVVGESAAEDESIVEVGTSSLVPLDDLRCFLFFWPAWSLFHVSSAWDVGDLVRLAMSNDARWCPYCWSAMFSVDVAASFFFPLPLAAFPEAGSVVLETFVRFRFCGDSGSPEPCPREGAFRLRGVRDDAAVGTTLGAVCDDDDWVDDCLAPDDCVLLRGGMNKSP